MRTSGREAKRSPEQAIGQPFGSPKLMSDGAVKTSLVQRVYEAIMDALDQNELRPGQRIIAAEVAKTLQLSRAPVREALHVLAGQGVVELLPDRGAVLRPMTRDDLAAIYEVVAPVAAIGMKAAARRIGEGDNAAQVQAAMQAIRDAAAADIRPRFRFYLVLNDYHYKLNAMAEKPYVDFLLRAINIEYWNRLLAEAIDLEQHIPGYVRNYERLTDAVLAGDERSVEAVMRWHAQWCIELLQKDTTGE